MTRPRKALILAAGFGTRFRPVTLDIPKPLLPMWGCPVLFRLIDMLADWGVRDLLINLHHAPNAIIDAIRRHAPFPLRLAFSFEPDILGTGGAVRHADWFLDSDPLWIVNGDIVADLSPTPLLRAFHRLKPLAALWVTDRAGPRTVQLAGDDIASFRTAHPGAPGTVTFCGLHLISPRLLSYDPGEPTFSIISAYERAQADGQRVIGVRAPCGFWADIGTPDSYLDAHAGLLARRRAGRCTPAWTFDPTPHESRADAFSAIAPDAKVSPRADVRDSVILGPCVITSRARLHRAVVTSGVRLSAPATGVVVPLKALDDPAADAAITRLGWRADRTAASILPPRGSDRSFVRVSQGTQTAMLIRYSLDRAENACYTPNARFLDRAGIRVPRVLYDNPSARVSIIEDVGNQDLKDYPRGLPPSRVHAMYARILTQAARLHGLSRPRIARAGLRLAPAFSSGVYAWEHDLFITHVLIARLHLPPATLSACRRELAGVACCLRREPEVLVHRDFQSSNILIHKGEPVWIDFQGMRFGPALYDVASLLYDPYVSLPCGTIDRLLSIYTAHAKRDLDQTKPIFRLAAVERLVQALGAYGRLSARRETRAFERYFVPGWRMLLRALDGAMETASPGLCGLREVAVNALRREESVST